MLKMFQTDPIYSSDLSLILSDKLSSEDFLLEDEVVPVLSKPIQCQADPRQIRSGMKLRQTRASGKLSTLG